MRNHENIKASVSKELAAAARDAVSSGDYATTSEVVQDALKLWKNRREIHHKDSEVLRARFRKGVASGDAGLLDIPTMIAEERKKARTR